MSRTLTRRSRLIAIVLMNLCATALTVMLLHGGGFILGSAANNQPDAAWLKAGGCRVVNPDYPLGSPAEAYRYVAEKATKKHVDLAFGWSAGGWLAEALAAHGVVKRAVAAAPVQSWTWHMPASFPQLPWIRPAGRVWIVHDPDDGIAPFVGSEWYVRKDPQARLKRIRDGQPEPHVVPASFYRPVLAHALDVLRSADLRKPAR